jgi:4,5-DOPA dioxygenase extradiol
MSGNVRDERMPVLFIGHGNPMNALTSNAYSRAWKAMGARLPRPKAIVSVSAHWYVSGTKVTATERPPTIHDFGGFPQALYEVEYPAPGDTNLAKRIADMLNPTRVDLDYESWGIDHGTWTVLRRMFPKADIPVVQLSIDRTKAANFHYDLGKLLSPLRDEDVLILASGNIVHNLGAFSWSGQKVKTYPWAVEFEAKVKSNLETHNHKPLIHYESLGEDAMLSVPTPDHYLPLLYAVALWRSGEHFTFPVEGIDGGSVSMLSVQIG